MIEHGRRTMCEATCKCTASDNWALPEGARVREYWICDPSEDRTMMYRLDADERAN